MKYGELGECFLNNGPYLMRGASRIPIFRNSDSLFSTEFRVPAKECAFRFDKIETFRYAPCSMPNELGDSAKFTGSIIRVSEASKSREATCGNLSELLGFAIQFAVFRVLALTLSLEISTLLRSSESSQLSCLLNGCRVHAAIYLQVSHLTSDVRRPSKPTR